MPKNIKENIIKGIHNGTYTPKRLPNSLYNATSEKLLKGINKDTLSRELAGQLTENIKMFSAAKTFQNVLQMSDERVDENGEVLPINEFEAIAGETYDLYNETWLNTEYDSTVAGGRMAEKWESIQSTKADQPYLQYSTTEDERVCEICEPLDGVTLPVDDPFWDANYPINHFGCECTVIQLDEEDAKAEGIDDSEEAEKWASKSQEEKNPLFNNNVGKSGEIFKSEGKDKHAYFDVPKEYKEFAQRNFDLPIN